MTDTSGMLPNWLSEAVGDRHDPKEIAQAVLRAKAWIDLIEEAVRDAEEIMRAQRSKVGPVGGYPSYNHEVARALISQLVNLYPEACLTKSRTRLHAGRPPTGYSMPASEVPQELG